MKKQAPKKGAPAWMATFADMSTLLLTFFVLMLSFASIDIAKFKDMLGSCRQAFGVTYKVKGEYQAVVTETDPPPTTNEEIKDNQSSGAFGTDDEKESEEEKKYKEKKQLEMLAYRVNSRIKKDKLDDQVEVIVGKDRVRIRIKGVSLFDPGKASLKSDALPFLETIHEGMTLFPYNLVVEGHTDNTPINNEYFPSNWELSAARASAVIRWLADKKISPEKLIGVGYGEFYPLVKNDSPEARSRNRRVEFIFTKQLLKISNENTREKKKE